MLPNQLSESPVSFAIRGVDYESVPKILPGGPRITTYDVDGQNPANHLR